MAQKKNRLGAQSFFFQYLFDNLNELMRNVMRSSQNVKKY